MEQRLKILRDSEVIGRGEHDFSLNAYSLLQAEGLGAAEGAEMFITHLAMAMARIKRGGLTDADEEDLRTQIIDGAGAEPYARATELWGKMRTFSDFEFPPKEDIFMIFHLCNVLKLSTEAEKA
jgi:hypothetical protein